MIKAVLLKPLDGAPEGTEREFSEADYALLAAMGAVKALRSAPANKMERALENKAAPAKHKIK